MLTYPKNIGRNFNEIIRTLEALQVSSELNVSTPANWEFGDDVIVSNDIPDEDIKEKYEVEEYNVFETFLRTIKQPGITMGMMPEESVSETKPSYFLKKRHCPSGKFPKLISPIRTLLRLVTLRLTMAHIFLI